MTNGHFLVIDGGRVKETIGEGNYLPPARGKVYRGQGGTNSRGQIVFRPLTSAGG